jgi:hypothetical protein
MENQLSSHERDMLLELGDRGAGGDFDQLAMSRLFTLGLVEVQFTDRRLILTKTGRALYQQLHAVLHHPPGGGRSSLRN